MEGSPCTFGPRDKSGRHAADKDRGTPGDIERRHRYHAGHSFLQGILTQVPSSVQAVVIDANGEWSIPADARGSADGSARRPRSSGTYTAHGATGWGRVRRPAAIEPFKAGINTQRPDRRLTAWPARGEGGAF